MPKRVIDVNGIRLQLVILLVQTARVRIPAFLTLLVTVSCFIESGHGQSLAPPAGTWGEAWVQTSFNQYVIHTDPNVTLRYTTNGVDPVVGDPIIARNTYLPIKRNLTFKAKAWSGAMESAVVANTIHLTGNVSAGNQHALLLKSSRELFAAGLQTNGRLGNGQTGAANVLSYAGSQKSAGVPIADTVEVAAGSTHTVIRDVAGLIWAFGTNGSGELGNNSTTQQAYPVQVTTGTGGVQALEILGGSMVSAGLNFSGALEGLKVWVWGSQSNGRLGNGTTSGSRKYAAPVKKSSNENLSDIQDFDLGDQGGLARSYNHSEYYGAPGNVWAWGLNSNGQLGTGNTTNQTYAAKVKLNATTDLTDAWEVSQGSAHSAIVRWKEGDSELQGSVWCMGLQTYGRLGNNVSGTGNTTYPVKVVKSDGSTLLGVEVVSAGPTHTLALDGSGQVWAWGYNGAGALGDGTTTNRLHAVKVQTPKVPGEAGYPGNKDLTGVTQISAGGTGTTNFSMALTEDGGLYVWGSNANGQLGNGTTTGSNVATRVNGVNVLPTPPDATLSASVTKGFYPGAVTLSAAVSDPDGASNIQKVEIYDQGTLVGTLTAAPWNVALTALPAGSHHAYAIVTDLQGNTGMSLPVDYVIAPDTDGDGMSDTWEIQWFGDPSNQNGAGDFDEDGVSNLAEQTQGTNPASAADGDGDGIPDDWELFWFGATSVLPGNDPDGDKITNVNEALKKTNPLSNADSDGDDLPDDWEIYWFGDITSQSGASNADSDHVTNAQEWTLNTNPTSAADGDEDGLPDDWERLWFTNTTSQSGASDADVDKISNAKEWLQGTNPLTAVDIDRDGLPDDWERWWFGDVTSQNGAGDADGDSVTNLVEFQQSTIPALPLADSDFDGIPDAQEDNDGDGMADVWEQSLIDASLTPDAALSSIHAGDDPDGDGLTNGVEYQWGLSPYQSDSDGDGYSDRLSVDQRVHLRLSETSGMTAADSSFSNSPGSLAGTPTWLPTGGIENGALEFHGGTDTVTLPPAVLNGVDSLTLSLWFKTSSVAAYQTLISGARSSQSAEFALTLENGTSVRFHYGAGHSVAWACGRNLANGLWHHLIATRDPATNQVALRLDGAILGAPQAVSLAAISVEAVTLGQRHLSVSTYDTTRPFIGLLDEVRVYSTALAEPQFTELFGLNDLDRDGLPDDYERALFGNLATLVSTAGDLDGDGLSNRQEFESGTHPNQYYNGVAPSLTLVSGSGQTIYSGERIVSPLVFRVMNGATPLVNAPVQFSHPEQIGELETLTGETAGESLDLRTDANGNVSLRFKAH